MKSKIQIGPRAGAGSGRARWLALILSAPLLLLRADSPPLVLQLRPDGTNSEGLPVVRLEWPAVSNATYKVKSAGELSGTGTIFRVNDLEFSISNGLKHWLDVISGELDAQGQRAMPPMKFYQLEAPQTEIYSIEPAYVAAGVETVVYLSGQCFGSNDIVRLVGPGGPWVLTNRVVLDANTMALTLPGVADAEYEIEIENATGLVTRGRDKVYAVSVPSGQQLLSLLEPPRPPVASPEPAAGLGPVALVNARNAANFNPLLSDSRIKKWSSTMTPGSHHLLILGKGGRDCDDDDRDGGVGGGVGGGSGDCDDARVAFNNWPGEFEVMPFSGEVQHRVVDMFVPGRGIDFVFARTYRSRSGNIMALDGRWDHSYNLHLQPLGGDLLINGGDGRADRYASDTNGVFTAPEFFNEGRFSNGVFVLTFPNGGAWEFRRIDGSPASGRIHQVRDRFGNALSFSYDAATGLLDQITDTLGRVYQFAYDSGRLVSVQDFSGRMVKFDYYTGGMLGGGAGDLASVTSPPVTGTPNGNDFPDGKTMRYTYSTGSADEQLNHNLLTVTDPKNQTWLEFAYHTNTNPADLDYDAVSYVLRGIDKKDIRRGMVIAKPGSIKPHQAMQAIVRDALGNVTEGLYDSRNRLLRLREYSGRSNPALPVTEKENRPQNPLRTNDPAFFETSVEWNSDSLPASITHPRGNVEKFVYRQDFGPVQASKRGDLRIRREVACCGGADTDGDGTADSFERVWRFDHHPDYGSPALNLRERINQLETRLKNLGLLARVRQHTDKIEKLTLAEGDTARAVGRLGNPLINEVIVTKPQEDFITAITDPRGFVTMCDYDTSGNRVKVRYPWLPGTEEDFGYNQYGQLTGKTHAPDANGCRRTDEFEYYDDPLTPGYGQLKTKKKDTGGYLCGTTDHFRIATTYEYDDRGNVIRIIDPRTNDWLFVRNALNQTTVRQTPKTDFGSRIATQFTYDANDNVTVIEHENRDHTGVPGSNQWWRTEFTYDALNRVTGCWRDKNGALVLRCTSASYDANDNVTLFRSGEAVNGHDPHAEVSLQYDERDLLYRVVHAPGSPHQATDQIDYSPNATKATPWKHHDIQGLDAPSLRITSYAYNGFDELSATTDAMGNVRQFAYDAKGNLKLHRVLADPTDTAGSDGNLRYHEWRWTYDAMNRVTSSRGAFFNPLTQAPVHDGELTHLFTYAPNGLLVSETDDAGAVTRYGYDTAHRLNTVTDAKSNVVVMARDACNNKIRIGGEERSDLSGLKQVFVVTSQFDALNRRTSQSDNRGNNENWKFDSRDNVVLHQDANGVLTFHEYDGLSRKLNLWTDKNADGTLSPGELDTLMAWDDNGRLVSETDANTNATTYAYDARDRRVLATSPDGTAHTFLWDAFNDLVSSMDPNGTVVSNRYDLNGRLWRRDIAPGDGVAATTTFERFGYDGMGRLVLASNNVSLVRLGYDSLGNGHTNFTDGLPVTRTFGQRGYETSLTYLPGDTVIYNRNILGLVTNVSRLSNGVSTAVANFAYAGAERLERIGWGNGLETLLQWSGASNSTSLPGDFGWRQVSMISHQLANGPVIDQRVAAYDPNQNKILRQQTVPWGPLPALTTNVFTYDAQNRMTGYDRRRASSVMTRSFELDAMGNRLSTTSNGVVSPYAMDGMLPAPADFQMNQYTITPFGMEQHDPNGNRVALWPLAPDGSPTFYRYDYAGRLVEVLRLGTVGIPEVVVSYSYDALGRRIAKTVPSGLAPALPVTTRYLRDVSTDEILAERVDGVVVASYTPARCPDGPCAALEMRRHGATYSLHRDELGSVLALTDSSGAVVEHCDYDSHGLPWFYTPDGVLREVPASTVGNPFLFHGLEWDSETELYASSHRYTGDSHICTAARHDPKSGRYIMRAGVPLRRSAGGNDSTYAGEAPWSLKKEAGGRHTPFHNKYRPQFLAKGGAGNLLPAAEAGHDQVARAILKSFFETGDQPVPPQFSTFLDSAVNRVDDRDFLGLREHSGRKILDRGEAGDNATLVRKLAPQIYPAKQGSSGRTK